MLSKGNSTPERCVYNLVKTIRGEVPFERIKGIDGAFIDQPNNLAAPLLLADIEFVIQTYEPRTQVENIDIDALAAGLGGFGMAIDIKNQ